MEFKKEWLSHFAKNISKSLLKKRVLGRGNFLWHLFSWEIVDKDKYLTGDMARKEVDKVDKSEAKYYSLWEDNPDPKFLEKEMDSKYIDKFDEIYVVASDWSWTYIKTHEEQCGPYFYHIVRSGTFSIENAKALIEYKPKYTVLETIDLAMQSYIDRGDIWI